MKRYEGLTIFVPNISEAELDKAVERFSSMITTRGGKVEKVEKQGVKRMAVPVNHHGEGWFIVWDFEATPDTIAELTRGFNIHDSVIRAMITVKVIAPPAPVAEPAKTPGSETPVAATPAS